MIQKSFTYELERNYDFLASTSQRTISEVRPVIFGLGNMYIAPTFHLHANRTGIIFLLSKKQAIFVNQVLSSKLSGGMLNLTFD